MYGKYENGAFTVGETSDHGVGTIWEANQAKANGTEIFAVGFDIGNSGNAYDTMTGVATDADHYKAATTTDISFIFDTIADTITKAIAKDVVLTDPLGDGFTLTTEGGTTYSENIDELSGTETIEFEIQYDTAHPAAGDTLPTNDGATLTYTDADGKPQIIHIGNPELENLARTVTYVDENGNAYTDPKHAAKPYWKGTEVTQAAAPTKQGYTFTGWEKTQGDVTVDTNGKFTIGSDNVTFKATWTKNTKTLTITKNWEGTTEKPTVTFQLLQARKGENAAVYQTFELDGIVDTGANGVEKEAWKATIEVPVKDTDGTEFKYSVKETKIGGTSIGAGAFNVTGTNPDKTSYIIGTWSVNSSGLPLDGTWTFTNKYAPKPQYTLTYEFVGEDKPEVEPPVAETLYEGQQTNLETVDAPEGWSFDGWYTNEGCTEGNKVTSPYTMPGSNMILYGKWEQKQPDVTVEKTATYTRNGVEMGDLPYDPKNPDKMGTVQVGDVIHYTVTITNAGDVVFGSNVSEYRGTDCFNYATGKLDVLDENGTKTGTIESGKCGNINIKGMEPKETRTFKYEYTVLPSDAGITINNNANVEIKAAGVNKTVSSKVNVKVEEPKPETATLRFEFKSGDDTITTLPQGVLNKKPADSDEVEVGTDVTLPSGFTEVTDTVNKGKWTFGGWYEDEDLNDKINGTTYPMPAGGGTLYGKWTFEADKPEITEAGYTVEYYRQDADGNYSNKPYYTRTTTDAGVPLKGNVGDTVKIEDLEPFYKEHYKGYEFDEDAENVRSLQLKADANENVLKLYYKAEALMTLDKDYVAYRDGEELDLSDGEELKAGDVIQYTITLKNTGTRNLTNVTVEDTFTGAEGELVFISGDAYEIDEDTGIISLKDTLKPGETVDIRADYEVQLNDSGWRITNEVLGDATELPPAGKPHASVTITPEALKNYEIHVSADKYVKSVKGTFNKDEEDVDFTFAVSSDKRGKNELDRFDITVDESVKAGETSSRFDGGITIRLTEEEFDDLKWETFEGDGKKYPVVYLREVKGSDKKMRYDTSVVTLYLLVPQVIVTSHDPIYKTTSLNAWVDPTDSTLWPEFTNVYGKESSSSDTVKVGPQLNRDDHVAYIMGYPDGTVQPKGEITRAEACTIFFRLLTDSSRDYYFSKTNDYTDVNAGDWFNNAISTLSNAGIVTGYNDGTFRPNQPITRGEMAKIIANFANLNKGTKSFTDLSGHWSKSYVELAAGNGWIAGYPDGSFRPDQKITRAETVTMINRVLERVPAKELRLLSRSIMLTFPDNNPGDWYYIAIQEASNSHEYQRSVYETTGDEMWTKLIDNVDWTKLEK